MTCRLWIVAVGLFSGPVLAASPPAVPVGAVAPGGVLVDDRIEFPFFLPEKHYAQQIEYPGRRHRVVGGVWAQDFAAPDCLVLAHNGESIAASRLMSFAGELDVREGDAAQSGVLWSVSRQSRLAPMSSTEFVRLDEC